MRGREKKKTPSGIIYPVHSWSPAPSQPPSFRKRERDMRETNESERLYSHTALLL